MKNFLSVGDNPLTIIIDKSPTTIISGQNGVGPTPLYANLKFVK